MNLRSNATLTIVFGLLLLVFLVVRFVRKPATERNFDSDIVQIDTSKITELTIAAATADAPIILKKTANQWTVAQGSVSAKAQKGSVDNILRELMAIRPQRLASTKKDKWEQFEVSDSTGTRVTVKEGKKETLDIIIGKTNFKQGPGGGNPQMGGQPNIIGESFVRLSDKKQVYGVEGFLQMVFRTTADNFRDKSFIQINTGDITRLDFRYPADSSFTIQKIDTVWQINDQIMDEAKVNPFVNQLTYKAGTTFENGFQATVNPDFQLIIEGNNGLQVVVKAWANGENYILNSSSNPNAYFSSTQNDLFGELFVGRAAFD